jgi:hypothetical protein
MDYESLSVIYNNDLWIRYKQKQFYTHFKHLIVWYDDGNNIDTYISPTIPEELFAGLLNWNKKTIQSAHAKKYLQNRTAIGRFGTIDELTGIIVFLSSEKSSFFHGSILQPDGGQSRQYMAFNYL